MDFGMALKLAVGAVAYSLGGPSRPMGRLWIHAGCCKNTHAFKALKRPKPGPMLCPSFCFVLLRFGNEASPSGIDTPYYEARPVPVLRAQDRRRNPRAAGRICR